MYIGTKIGLKEAKGSFSCDLDWSDKSKQFMDFKSGDPSITFNFTAPAYAQVSVLCWRYQLANAQFLEAAKNEWVALREVMAMGNRINIDPIRGAFPWADIFIGQFVRTKQRHNCNYSNAT